MSSSNKGQMSIDFLIGMIIFAGVVVFVFQFMSSTILPFTESSGDKVVEVHSVADELYYEKLSTDEPGEVDLSYFLEEDPATNAPTKIKDEPDLEDELAVRNTTGLNISVRVHNGSGPAEFAQFENASREFGGSTNTPANITVGPDPPNVGASVARATRVGYWERGTKEPQTVIINVRMW